MAYTAKQKKVGAEVEGAKEIAKLLKDMGRAAEDILEEAAYAGGKVALDDAKRRVPERTGRLKRNLYVKIGRKTPFKADVRLSYPKEVYYAKFVELGTKHRPATPFMRPAVDENQGKISKEVTGTVSKRLGRFR